MHQSAQEPGIGEQRTFTTPPIRLLQVANSLESVRSSVTASTTIPPEDSTPPPARGGQKWSKLDDNELIYQWLAQKPLHEIASHLERTEMAVVMRFWSISGPIAQLVVEQTARDRAQSNIRRFRVI